MLTACVIVRDEERALPDCLAALQAVADRVVVVDLGSRDGTIALARERGSDVFEFKTSGGDVAAARNFSISTVQSGFVLAIDAHERLGPGACEALRRALRRDRLDLGLLPVREISAGPGGPDAPHPNDSYWASDAASDGRGRGAEISLLPRLFRRTDDLRWDSAETGQLSGWLSARERNVEIIDAPLLRPACGARLLDIHPGDLALRAVCARELARSGEHAAALGETSRIWSAVRSRGASAGNAKLIPTLGLHAWLLLQAGRGAEVLEVLTGGRSLCGEHPGFLLLEGSACERLALESNHTEEQDVLLARAETALSRSASADADALGSIGLPTATPWCAATRLGTVRLLAARPLQARDAFELALNSRRDHLEARLGVVEAMLDANMLRQAVAAAQPLLKHDSADAWLLAAAAAGSMDRADDLRLFASQTKQALARAPFIAPHRRFRWRAIERALAHDAA